MSTETFLWIEDRKSKAGYTFWENMMEQICPGVIVESKRNSSELVKAVKSLKDHNNKYIIVFDNSFDNLQAVMELKLLKQYADERANIFLMDIICFEYILLEFKDIITWIYAPNDELLDKRANVIKARGKLIASLVAGVMDYKGFREIVEYDDHIKEHNIEQLAAKLLFDLTRNTGFEVTKGTLGECWIRACCEWGNRGADDICGLNLERLSAFDKMKCIYEGTELKEKFQAVGLEVLL